VVRYNYKFNIMEADVLVTQILNTKKSNGVVMVTHNTPVKEVADVLSARNIGLGSHFV
jgi:ABC-type lipoprotein export system ATPase subunit